jgi:adenine-specific DNA methylase
MIPAACKRLIEVDFPIAAVSAHSAQEKSIRHGHPSTLHLWWARRPLAACRAVLLGLLLPDPCDEECPASFKSAARHLLAKRYGSVTNSDAELRELLLKFIGEFANWDHAANALYLEIGRGLVKAAHPEDRPLVADPFAGGGSIPLEALRLGCEALASDLNPVACLILKTLLEDIPRYGNTDFKLADKYGKQIVVQGLADALRHVGRQTKEAAEKELVQFYPADPDGSRPIAYLWARTVRCEAVGCGAEIPLVRSFWLCKKAGRKQALRYRIEKTHSITPRPVFEIFGPKKESDVPDSSVDRANATCLCCNIVLPAKRVRAQLASQRGGADVVFDKHGKRVSGATILAVVMLHDNKSGRQYRLPNERDYKAIYAAQSQASSLGEAWLPNEPSPWKHGHRAVGSPRVYGMNTWGNFFTARQKLALATFSKAVAAVSSATPQLQSVKALLAFCIDKLADLSNTCCRWEPVAECPRQLFARQALPMVWDIAEGMPIGESSGSFEIMVERESYVLDAIGSNWMSGQVQQADACNSPLPTSSTSVWCTDPPYWDNVAYADLSDFFFVWLKRMLPQHPLLSDPVNPENILTPKAQELTVTTAVDEHSPPKDGKFFFEGMGRAFAEGRRVLRQDGIGCVVFAHKTTEGWESLLTGMLHAGWVITASWPITTEMATRMVARDTAALAGSVHLVCRPRDPNAGVGDWSEVKATMERRIRQWLPTLLKHGVRGADAIFSCLGPALESYSKHEKVLTAADREVPLGGDPGATEPHERGFLAYVFETLSKEALRQVLGDAETERFEEDARLTALFLWTLQATKGNGNGAVAVKPAEVPDEGESGDEEEKPMKAKPGFSMPFDTFIRITRPMGIHYPALEHRIIEIEKGVVRLLPVKERTEQLLGEAAERPGIELTIQDFRQLELGLVEKKKTEITLPTSRGRRGAIRPPEGEVEFTTLDRIHRTMLLFRLGRSTLLRQVLEDERRKGKGFERLALALNALYPDRSEERRMLEGVQAAMRGMR